MEETQPPRQDASALRRYASFVITVAAAAGVLLGAARKPRAGALLSEATADRDRVPRVQLPAMDPAPDTPKAVAIDSELLPEGDRAPSCNITDPGSGNFAEWTSLPVGKVTWSEPKADADYDLVVHFHGGEPARRVLAPIGMRMVLATVDLGVGSGAYERTFQDPTEFDMLLDTVDGMMAPARRRRLILTSWSAGYGAIRVISRQNPGVADGLVMLDSIHASYSPDGRTPDSTDMQPFVDLAQRTQAGDLVMVLTHSAIRPPGYAATKETADYLIGELAGQRRYAGLVPQYGVEVKTRFDRGSFHVRGTTGTTKAAHCAHLRMLGTVLQGEVFPALGIDPFR